MAISVKLLRASLAGLALMIPASAAMAQPPHMMSPGEMPYMMGPGMMGPGMMGPGMMGPGMMGRGPAMLGWGGYGRHGMMGPMGPGMHGLALGPVWTLDLTDKQRDAIRKIYRDLRQKHFDLRESMARKTDDLWELYGEDQLDPKKIGDVYGEIFDLRRQMIVDTIKARNEVYQQLNDEQREELRKRWQEWDWG